MTVPNVATRKWLASPRTQSIINVFVIITLAIGVFASYTGVQNNRRTADYTACLAQYNDTSQRYSAARSALNQKQIDATNQVILAVATAKVQSDVRTALDKFTAEQEAIAQEKKETPIPAPPSKVCR